MTNAQKIREMSDEELIEFIKNIKVRAALCKAVKTMMLLRSFALLSGSNSQRKYPADRYRMPWQINFCPMCGRRLYLPKPTTAEANS